MKLCSIGNQEFLLYPRQMYPVIRYLQLGIALPHQQNDTNTSHLFSCFLGGQAVYTKTLRDIFSAQYITMDLSRPFNVVLVEPEIPPNTGSIARLCGATNSTLHLVHPLGFSVEDKHLKRAGLDYWPHVDIVHWDNLDTFLRATDEKRLYFYTTKVDRSYTTAQYKPGDYLIFGKETKGLPAEIRDLYLDRCYTLPMSNPHIRSLNLAMTAGIVLYEALRQQAG